MKQNYLLRVALKPLIPFIMIFGLYVQFHGDYGPGGGFQAGVIFAAAIILYALVWGPRDALAVFSRRGLERMAAAGVLLYGSVGVAAMLRGGNFLDYGRLAHDPLHGQHWGILFVELGVGLTVTAVMTLLFLLFVMRGRL
ncbi:MAG: Na(+)/H(+) antiporter subunit B [Thermoanaerobaculia bacterium]